MYLKSLEVHGFKSFANKLVFEFHNGITAIVGPNGSGKSNVADAVRWVLGEQRAKQLRGAKMEDVIFAGTELRRPLGYAYVAITISNEDHKLPVPYEEVKIARRVYRSGESEYLLNGASCRLKDVQELLFDTGIGKEGYSIIGQGQIDQILSGRPEERRELFDEAAGIVKYKKRKEAAEKNLEEEQQNLVRIEDILSELKKQVGPLKEQSEKAREYLAYRDELRNLDINVFLKEYDRIHGEITEVEGKQEIAAKELEEAGKELERTREEYVAVEKELEEHSQGLEKMREDLNQDTLSLNQSEGDIKVLKEQINTARQSREHNVEVIASLKERIDSARQEEEGYLAQKEELSRRVEGLRQAQSDTRSRIDAMAEEMASLEAGIEQCNQDIIALLNENTEVKAEEQRVKTLQEQNNLKKAELTRRMLENKTETGILEEVLQREKAALDDISDKLAALEAGIGELKNSRQALEEQEKALRREHRDTQQNYHMDHSRLVSLKNITERYEGFGQSIRRVMEQKPQYPGIVGVVADIIRVNKEYELAVETALGGSIQNIVTDNEQTAKDMIQFLKKNRYGRATFLPLTNIKAKPVNLSGNILSEPGVIGIASSLVAVDARFQSLIEYLLGRFVVMDHIDNAIALARKYHHTIRIVTREGDLLNPGGSMSGGAFKNSNNLLGRRREMEDLEKRTKELSEKLESLSADIKKNHKESEDVEARLSANRKTRQEFFLQQNTAQGNYNRAVQDLQDMEEKRELIRLESGDTNSRDEELKKEIQKISGQLAANEAQSNERRELMAKQSERLEEIKEEHERLSDEDSHKLMALTAEEQKGKSIEENLERVAGELSKLEEELAEVSKSGEDADAQVREKESAILRTREQITGFAKHIRLLQESIEGAVAKKEALTEQHKGFFEKREALSTRQAELDKECFRLANQKEKLAEQLDGRTNYMWEQYELTYHGAEEVLIPVELELSGMKSRIGELKNAMKALGDININAVEQYKEVKERYELLEGQHSDLVEAAEVLMGIIDDLDSSMRTQFEEQFGEIRTRFDKVFKELFGGGRGTLELTEDEDILLAGIRIVAQPPGKKLQNMMQLSGGEKALTAIALLFAIQSLKPSPFCLLDEIEAALDDSNVTRFARYLHKLIKDTQFIVITHRRGTMNAADRLYGITMQEKGVSTLVSVNLLEEGLEDEAQQAT